MSVSGQVESVSDYRDRTPLFPGTSCPSLSPSGSGSGDRDHPFGPPREREGEGEEGEGGGDRLDQLHLILGVIGTPGPEDVRAIGDPEKENFLLHQMPFRTPQVRVVCLLVVCGSLLRCSLLYAVCCALYAMCYVLSALCCACIILAPPPCCRSWRRSSPGPLLPP